MAAPSLHNASGLHRFVAGYCVSFVLTTMLIFGVGYSPLKSTVNWNSMIGAESVFPFLGGLVAVLGKCLRSRWLAALIGAVVTSALPVLMLMSHDEGMRSGLLVVIGVGVGATAGGLGSWFGSLK